MDKSRQFLAFFNEELGAVSLPAPVSPFQEKMVNHSMSGDSSLRIFRLLLLLSVVAGLIGGGLDFVLPSLIPEALSSAVVASEPETSSLQLAAIILGGLVLLFFWLLACYGLYSFRSWAPRLALGVSVISLAVYPLLGVSVVSGWAMVFADMANTAWGAVLALAYLSPLKEAFVTWEG